MCICSTNYIFPSSFDVFMFWLVGWFGLVLVLCCFFRTSSYSFFSVCSVNSEHWSFFLLSSGHLACSLFTRYLCNCTFVHSLQYVFSKVLHQCFREEGLYYLLLFLEPVPFLNRTIFTMTVIWWKRFILYYPKLNYSYFFMDKEVNL